jgi:hypothetical protein
MIGIEGGWDTHSNNLIQGDQNEELFATLDAVMEKMATTPGTASPYLIDEVVIVCLSEFGRTPKFNGGNGKDHWPYSSALVVGAGVKGNQRVGYTDDSLVSQPINLATGQPDSGGDIPAAENLGVALLRLASLDPEQFLPGVQGLDALRA